MGTNPPDPDPPSDEGALDETLVAEAHEGIETAETIAASTDESIESAVTVGTPEHGEATGSSALESGSVLAETYEVSHLIGQGAFGAVWEATHRRLAGRKVAIKVLHAAVTSDEVLARFRHEAEAAARIVHPNVVTVLDYNTLPTGQPYIVLEHLQGEPLGERLERGGLTVDEALGIAEQIGRALHAAHRQGVIHRDLKPDNVFLCESDGDVIAKVVDFGISKIADSETVKTQDSAVIGTPCYMSPEQARGDSRKVDARSDVFSLGSMVYELLTGKRAFDSEKVVSTLYRIIHEEPPPMAELNPEVPPSVIAAVAKALSKAPDDRFSDMASFVEALTGHRVDLVEEPTAAASPTASDSPSILDTDLSMTAEPTIAPERAVSRPPWQWAVLATAIALVWVGVGQWKGEETPGVEEETEVAVVATAKAKTEAGPRSEAKPETVTPITETRSEAKPETVTPITETGTGTGTRAEPSPVVKAEAETATATDTATDTDTEPTKAKPEPPKAKPEPPKPEPPKAKPDLPKPKPEPLKARVKPVQAKPKPIPNRAKVPGTRARAPGKRAAARAPRRERPPELDAAQAALKRGHYREALRQAKKSLVRGKTPEAYEVIVKALCAMKNLPDAKGKLGHLAGPPRRRAIAWCKKKGLDL